MLKYLAFILILSSNLVFSQTSSEVSVDKKSTTNQPTSQNVVIVAPISIAPYHNTEITSQKSVVTIDSDSSINSNEIYIQPINVTPINQASTKSNKSISESSTNTEIKKNNVIVIPAIIAEKYIGQTSIKAIENK